MMIFNHQVFPSEFGGFGPVFASISEPRETSFSGENKVKTPCRLGARCSQKARFGTKKAKYKAE